MEGGGGEREKGEGGGWGERGRKREGGRESVCGVCWECKKGCTHLLSGKVLVVDVHEIRNASCFFFSTLLLQPHAKPLTLECRTTSATPRIHFFSELLHY
jgi:hypothetical protein